jgi:hypothetical protein
MEEVTIQKIDKPKGVNRISNRDILNGKTIPAIDRVKLMSPQEYEDFILEWVDGYLGFQFDDVVQLGGAGDKGRDIIGYVDKAKTICDYYQCKHYENQLTPTDIYVELGKIIYYTFKKIIPIPRNHFLVAPKGEGPALHDLLIDKIKLKEELKSNWDKYCLKKISSSDIELKGEFLDYFDKFDFAIFGAIQPLKIIEEHKKTTWHPGRFGGGLTRTRGGIPSAELDIQDFEMAYVEKLFEVYSELGGTEITNKDDLLMNAELKEHFEESRNSFYSAESLKQFSRDNLPPSVDAFGDFKSEVYSSIRNVVRLEHDNGYTRLLKSSQAAIQNQYSSNPLHMEIKAQDKEGACHHLANENKVTWVKKEK